MNVNDTLFEFVATCFLSGVVSGLAGYLGLHVLFNAHGVATAWLALILFVSGIILATKADKQYQIIRTALVRLENLSDSKE